MIFDGHAKGLKFVFIHLREKISNRSSQIFRAGVHKNQR
ncbi:MAG: hypothetical protein PWQ53_1261 [Bacteroidota bacterium]|jgi:hypothetical protein|nr:hypothetical protein [Methermicoccus sp.]MDK2969692.1 hypothetical protein [Bacteroidota bacterium]MDN5306602.1 hypothetical protein [Bacteroidota bacterium]